MPLKLITPPLDLNTSPAGVLEPVGLTEFKNHCHIPLDFNLDDFDIQTKITAARVHVEGETKRALLASTWDLYLDRFPCGCEIRIPLGQLQSVASVTYILASGTSLVLDPSTYEVDAVSDPGRITLAYNRDWPLDILKPHNAVVIRFTCGWADPASVPANIRLAIELLASTWYRNRESVIVGNTAASVSTKLADGVDSLIGPWSFRGI